MRRDISNFAWNSSTSCRCALASRTGRRPFVSATGRSIMSQPGMASLSGSSMHRILAQYELTTRPFDRICASRELVISKYFRNYDDRSHRSIRRVGAISVGREETPARLASPSSRARGSKQRKTQALADIIIIHIVLHTRNILIIIIHGIDQLSGHRAMLLKHLNPQLPNSLEMAQVQ